MNKLELKDKTNFKEYHRIHKKATSSFYDFRDSLAFNKWTAVNGCYGKMCGTCPHSKECTLFYKIICWYER